MTSKIEDESQSETNDISIKKKVTFIGTRTYGLESLNFYLKRSVRDRLSDDRLFKLWLEHTETVQTFSLKSLYLLSKLNYDVEIIGEGEEEFAIFCKEIGETNDAT